jgi:simple sugar transport system ATP-binding protein
VKNPFIEFFSITKKFDQFYANSEITFAVQKGTIHALVGENGAGKSTLMKILFGLLKATSGEIRLVGEKIEFDSPQSAKRSGIGMVHQHFQLAGSISALDHILLEQDGPGFERLHRRRILNELEELSARFQMPVPWQKKVESLSVGIQQRIEIIKLLYRHAEILIFDEPTAVLSPQEIQALFSQLRILRQEGKTILLITHKLKEVLSIADDVTVLRKGQAVHSGPAQGVSEAQLAQWIVGRPPKRIVNCDPVEATQTLLSVQKLSLEQNGIQQLRELSFSVKAGEIVGIAGVEGNGQAQLLQCLMRPSLLSQRLSGKIFYKDVEVRGRSLRDFNAAYFPEDRLHQGLLIDQPAPENFLLGQQRNKTFQLKGFLNWALIKHETQKVLMAEAVTPQNINLPLAQFSGGNQQKFVVGRELHRQAQLVIAAHPTRGVDIGAIEHIHEKLLRLRTQGVGVLLVSSELEELMALADRILIFFNGEIVGEQRRADFDENQIGQWMTAGRTQS